ncbi:MAG: SAM-dependent methyltransferase [Anaerolineales bacterium]
MTDEIRVRPVARIHNLRRALGNEDHWGGVVSEIVLDQRLPDECLVGLETFSHAEIIFYFHKAAGAGRVPLIRHPRDNPVWPKVGVFAQRNKNRPNSIGLSVVRIIRREERSLFVEGLDALDGTPVLDIKPIMEEFLPHGEVHQPEWSHELMNAYWNRADDNG